MKNLYCTFVFIIITSISFGQTGQFTIIKNNAATPVKNQGRSGTCWCYSSTAMTESELLLVNKPALDLSETFTVYNLYIDKAIKLLIPLLLIVYATISLLLFFT